MNAPHALDGIDLLDLDRFVRGEHHDMFRRLRSEAPVSWHAEREGPGFWNVVLHRDLVEVNRDAELFSSDTKYESGSGWPSFYEALDPEKVTLKEDRSHGMVRTEALCANCGAHLGHVFPDGPRPTGDRFCMNSASLNLKSDDD